MKRSLWRLAAASGFAACVALGAVPAGASGPDVGHRPSPGAVQVADQAARTEQYADSHAKSEQFLPVNANVPVQIVSLGSNGGDTKQSNDSTAKSAAVNEAKTSQSVDQNQVARGPHGSYGDRPEGHDHKGHQPERRDCREDHGRKDDHRKGDDSSGHGPKGDSYGHGPKGDDSYRHGPKQEYPKQGHDDGQRSEHGSPGPFQGAEQYASTDQDANSSATSKQYFPTNVNAPIQILSLGHNGGDTKQSNDSTAKSAAVNDAWTGQRVLQDQAAGRQSKGYDGGQRYGHGPDGPFQGAAQYASTDQDANSSATSKQIAPVNVNAPIQVLSLGSNGGDTWQSNDSTAKSAAVNEAGTKQSASQDQGSGSGAAFQGASQSASTDQDANSSATSKQIAPLNVNAPIQVLSLGHNGGDTAQSNSSSAQSFAGNQAGTSQGIGQAQGLLG